MKLYATVTSERASKGQGGNDFVRVELQRERGKLSHVLEYTTAGLRLSQITDDGGVILFEQREETEKGEKQKGENPIFESPEKTIKRIISDTDTRYDDIKD